LVLARSLKTETHNSIQEDTTMKKINGLLSILVMMLLLIITPYAAALLPREGDRQSGIKTNDLFLTASTPRKNQQAPPEGLTSTQWETIQASIERDRYRVHTDERTGTYTAPNYAHNLYATFTQRGITVGPRNGKKGWRWGLRLISYGYGSNLQAVTNTDKMIPKDNRIAYLRGDMVEWYINDHRGLEQGFTVSTRPSGQRGSEPLQLSMQTAGNLIPVVEKEKKGIVFRNTQGKNILRYSGLSAYDATGKTLYTRMEADQEEIRLIVDDHEAVYPITIDPFIETKKLTAGDGTAEDYFGSSVSISGNTAIVGAPGDDDNGTESGSAYIFSRNQGGTDNWGEVQKLLASDGAAGDYFGWSLSISGNMAIVGAPIDDDNGGDSGSAYIFSRNQGGTDNWGEVQKLLASDGAAYDYFGHSVSISGNTAIVGAVGDDDNGDYSGSAYIFSDVFNDELAVDFSTNGLWHWDGDTWTQINAQNPEALEAWNGGLAADFDGNGLWTYNGASWDLLTTLNPASMEAWNTELAVYFAGNGLWSYNGATWSLLTTNAAQDMQAWSGGLAVDFGAFGLWTYDGSSWSLLTTSNASDMAAWSRGLAVDFGTSGLWSYDGSSWSLLTTNNPEAMQAWSGGLAVDFGAFGLWTYDGSSWSLLTTSNAISMADWDSALAVDVPSGLWSYNGSSWRLLTTTHPEDMEGWATSLAADLGTSGLWNYDGAAWSQLTGWNAEEMVDVDVE
jgi:hypothetical protein